MERLLEGVRRFQKEVFPEKRELFKKLAKGQHPRTLFITCADSRVDPELITQSEPGEIFVARNAGNLVPPEGSVRSSEAASVEYAVKALGVRHIVVCGHSGCGAMKAVQQPATAKGLEAVQDWLTHAQEAWRATQAAGARLKPEDQLTLLIEQNVMAQLRNLMTYPAVAEAVANKHLDLHGWVYDIENGTIMRQDPAQSSFLAVT